MRTDTNGSSERSRFDLAQRVVGPRLNFKKARWSGCILLTVFEPQKEIPAQIGHR